MLFFPPCGFLCFFFDILGRSLLVFFRGLYLVDTYFDLFGELMKSHLYIPTVPRHNYSKMMVIKNLKHFCSHYIAYYVYFLAPDVLSLTDYMQ